MGSDFSIPLLMLHPLQEAGINHDMHSSASGIAALKLLRSSFSLCLRLASVSDPYCRPNPHRGIDPVSHQIPRISREYIYRLILPLSG